MFLTNRQTLLLIIVVALGGCNSAEIARLQNENDSLRNELHSQQAAVEGLRNVTSWLDSIDINRNLLLVNFTTSPAHLEISARLLDIHHFVIRSSQEIQALEQELASSSVESSGYLALLGTLKDEVRLRTNELAMLNEFVIRYMGENAGLKEALTAGADEIISARRDASAKDQALLFLEARIQALAATFRMSEADAWYARAAAVEETAKRTKLAPRKRRETYNEALELYRKALSLGKASASEDVARLEKTR